MKNVLVSALVVAALTCPVAFAADETKTAAPETMAPAASATQDGTAEAAKPAPKKAKKSKKRAKKRKVEPARCTTCDGETPAERRIDEESGFNNR